MRQIILGACNDSLLFPCAMKSMDSALENIPMEKSGAFGMAVVMEKELILRKRPINTAFAVSPLLTDLHTNLLVATHEHENHSNFRAEHALPDRYRGWIFTLSGPVPDLLLSPDGPMSETIPSFLKPISQRKTHGSSLFAWALARFYEAGFLERIPDRREQAMEIIAQGLKRLRELTGLLALPFTFAIANREFISGFIGERGLLSHGFSGLRQCDRCQDPFAKRRNKPHPHLQSHILTTPMEGMGKQWNRLDPNQCFLLKADGQFSTINANQ